MEAAFSARSPCHHLGIMHPLVRSDGKTTVRAVVGKSLVYRIALIFRGSQFLQILL